MRDLIYEVILTVRDPRSCDMGHKVLLTSALRSRISLP